MPYETHARCDTPTDDTPIWRYMSLERLLDLLASRELHFARLDQFEDPWEARYPGEQITEWVLPDGSVVARGASLAARNLLFACCWNESRIESDALWRLYSARGLSVAIRTTVGRLKSALAAASELPVHISRIKYIDYATTSIPEGNLFDLALRKRKSFDYECEVRAILTSSKPAFEAARRGDPRLGKSVRVSVDVGALIESVFLSPLAPSSTLAGIEAAVRAMGFNFELHHSSLYTAPPTTALRLPLTWDEAEMTGLRPGSSDPSRGLM